MTDNELKDLFNKMMKEEQQKSSSLKSDGLAVLLVLLLLPFALFMGIVTVAIDAYVVMMLWQWFLAGTFGVSIGYMAAFGIAIFLSIFEPKIEDKDGGWKAWLSHVIARNVLRPLTLLGIGYAAMRLLG